MENSIVSEAGAMWSGLPQSEEDQVIALYQCGPPDPEQINPWTSYVNSREDQDSLLGYLRLPPPLKNHI